MSANRSAITVVSLLFVLVATIARAGEVVAEIRLHGNYQVHDNEVKRLAGISVGDPVSDAIVAQVSARLRESHRFEHVEVSMRYRSMSASDDVALIIVVHERESLSDKFLALPILERGEERGFAYGMRLSADDLSDDGGRLGLRATWGEDKGALIDAARPLRLGLINRIGARAGWSRYENPHYEQDDERLGVSGSLTRKLGGGFHLAALGGWHQVNFAARRDASARRDHIYRYGLSLEMGRGDRSAFPRRALEIELGLSRFDASTRDASAPGGPEDVRATLPRARIAAYYPAFGATVLALRAEYVGASARLPEYEKPLLGGATTLRGFAPGAFAGDRRGTGSLEWRIPVTSPRQIIQAGIRAFLDMGFVTDHGSKIGDARIERGYGLGIFGFSPFGDAALDVARSREGDVRLHVSAGLRL